MGAAEQAISNIEIAKSKRQIHELIVAASEKVKHLVLIILNAYIAI
jgi:hypothetical protein